MASHDELVGKELESFEHSWTSKDALLYAVGVGASEFDPLSELEFTTENSEGIEQAVLPTFAALMQRPGATTILSFDRKGLVHGNQGVTLYRPIPAEGSVTVSAKITGIYDKGSGALATMESHTRLSDTDEPLSAARTGLFFRGEGGFGGPRGPESNWEAPDRAPDFAVTDRTIPGQALLYRLTGDRNPLHSDPTRAKAAGFDRPILHGMCTYGVVGRALVRDLCEGAFERFGSMDARFSKPVFPGETLETLIWRTDDGAKFQARVGDRVVLDHGEFTFAG